MNRFATLTLIATGMMAAISIPPIGPAQATYTGTVKRVWEDGFRLHIGDRTLWVDAWDLYGDNTLDNIAVGDRISVTGEFERIEFDASSIAVAASPSP
ncbi:MAG: hypothetical protein QNJ46_23760 [Leptolyngbyaceae cyanobacterium MO_188.B28]|nr:hypothetical protein [Leptolyngbyaceae cyanobacterium MO_188.B28]